MIESALDIRGVIGTGGVLGGPSNGGESINVGGGLSSFSSASVELSFGGAVGTTLDLLAAFHGGGDNEVISGASCCDEDGARGRVWDLEFWEGAGLGGFGSCLKGLLGGTGNGASCGDR